MHVPCGKKVVVVCTKTGEKVTVRKNGTSIYTESNDALSNTAPTEEEQGEELEVEVEEEEEEGPETNEKNSEETIENNMAGGRKSRRNTMRKNNVTRRKNQAGGKRAPNRYMKFANKIRPQIIKEHPELKSDVVGVARKIGAKWRSMSDSEKSRY